MGVSNVGESFLGWYVNGSLISEELSYRFQVTENRILEARFSNAVSGGITSPNNEEANNFPFKDVALEDWFYEAIKYAYENDLFEGTSSTTFTPNGTMTRAMMVTVLYRLAGEPAAGNNKFTDVPDGTWYTDAVSWAAANEIVSGIGNNLFAPNEDITREQMAAILYRYCQRYNIELPTVRISGAFADYSSINNWAKEAVEAMYKAEVLNGKGNNIFDPQGNATRAEVAQMFMNFMEVIK